MRGQSRVQVDNEQQRAYEQMTNRERIAQSDLYTQDEKAQMLFAMQDELYEGFTEEELKGTMTPEAREKWFANQKEIKDFGEKAYQPANIEASEQELKAIREKYVKDGVWNEDLAKVYALLDRQESKDGTNQFGNWIKGEYGGVLHVRNNLKSWNRAIRKVNDVTGAKAVKDINGMTLLLPTMERAYEVYEDLKKKEGSNIDGIDSVIVSGKDRYTNKIDGTPVMEETHYRDFLLNVQLKNGAIFELQLNTPQMFYAKERMVGHTLYEIVDAIKIAHEEKKTSGEYRQKLEKLCDAAQVKLYDAAFEAAKSSANFNAFSLDMRLPLWEISTELGQPDQGISFLSSDTRKIVIEWGNLATGKSSTSVNSNLGSSNDGTSAAGGVRETGLSTGAAEAETTESLYTSVPSTSNIAQNQEEVKGNLQENEKKDILFQIIGEQGAETLDKAEETTTRLDSLSVARQMEQAGKDVLAVRHATGWERGADGKWRYEIPDIQYHPNADMREGRRVYLEMAIKADSLFKAYPELKTYTIQREDLGYNMRADFNVREKAFVVNKMFDFEQTTQAMRYSTQYRFWKALPREEPQQMRLLAVIALHGDCFKNGTMK